MNRILLAGTGGPTSYNVIQFIRHNPKEESFFISWEQTSALVTLKPFSNDQTFNISMIGNGCL